MQEYTVYLSDSTTQKLWAESGAAARRQAAQCIRRGVEGFTSPGVTIYRVRVVNRW